MRSAEAKRSPTQILLFPWAIIYANCLLVNLAADACHSAKVPITLYLNHAQSEDTIKIAADLPGCPFDNILVDMAHYEKEENLAKAKALTEYRHARGIATETDPGHMEDGENGVRDMEGLEGVLTMPEKDAKLIEELAQNSVDVVGSDGRFSRTNRIKAYQTDMNRWSTHVNSSFFQRGTLA
jgi:fructose-bisphosphate aldolase, class II